MSVTSRRWFAKSIVVAGAAAFAPVSGGQAILPVQADPTGRIACPPLPYTAHLTGEEVARITKDFADVAPYLESFRKYKLANADEPDFTFHSLAERW
jgi:hypothetical protein